MFADLKYWGMAVQLIQPKHKPQNQPKNVKENPEKLKRKKQQTRVNTNNYTTPRKKMRKERLPSRNYKVYYDQHSVKTVARKRPRDIIEKRGKLNREAGR